MTNKDSGSKFKIIMIILFFVFGLLIFFTLKYASQSLQLLNIIWFVCIFVVLGMSAFACPSCYKWFKLKEIEKIELARSKGTGILKLGTLEYFDWINPKATEEDKLMLIQFASSQDELFGPKENRLSKGSGVIWSKIFRRTIQCSSCKYKFPKYKKSSHAFSVQSS